jgi:hypothetical protein
MPVNYSLFLILFTTTIHTTAQPTNQPSSALPPWYPQPQAPLLLLARLQQANLQCRQFRARTANHSRSVALVRRPRRFAMNASSVMASRLVLMPSRRTRSVCELWDSTSRAHDSTKSSRVESSRNCFDFFARL